MLPRLCLALALVLAARTPASAQSPDAIARARTHFEAGRALYNLGNYTDAIREFSAGYELAPRPQFLVNLGQAYRKLGDLPRARDMYRKYLEVAPSTDPDRPQVKQILVELERQLAATPAPSPAPIVPVPASTPTVTPEPQPTAQAVSTAAPPPHRPFLERHWWIFPVGAVVLAGAAVGIYFAVKPAAVDCGAATLGCIDAGRP